MKKVKNITKNKKSNKKSGNAVNGMDFSLLETTYKKKPGKPKTKKVKTSSKY